MKKELKNMFFLMVTPRIFDEKRAQKQVFEEEDCGVDKHLFGDF